MPLYCIYIISALPQPQARKYTSRHGCDTRLFLLPGAPGTHCVAPSLTIQYPGNVAYRANGFTPPPLWPDGRMLSGKEIQMPSAPSRFPTGCAAHVRADGVNTQPRGSEIGPS